MVHIMGQASILLLRFLLRKVISAYRVNPIFLDIFIAVLFALVIESWMITGNPNISMEELVKEVEAQVVHSKQEPKNDGVVGKKDKFTFTLWPDGKYTGYHDGKEWVGTWKLVGGDKSLVRVTEWKIGDPNHGKFKGSYSRRIELSEGELNILGELPCSRSGSLRDVIGRAK